MERSNFDDFITVSQRCLQIIQKSLEEYLSNNNINTNLIDSYNYQSNQINNKDALFYLNFFIRNWSTLNQNFYNNYILSIANSLKYFRNKISHQSPVTLREMYKFIDDTQILLENLNVNHNDINSLNTIRKQVLSFMINTDDNIIVLGRKNYNNFESSNMQNQYEDMDIDYSEDIVRSNNKINECYNKIMSNSEPKNFYNCKVLSGDGEF